MIDLTVNKEALERNIQKARENRITNPEKTHRGPSPRSVEYNSLETRK